jgi:hypothetical protein
MSDLLTSPRFLLMRLASETTIDAYLLQEDEDLMELIKGGSSYETLFEYCNENY